MGSEEALPQRIERAGTDVSVNDADRGQREWKQRPASTSCRPTRLPSRSACHSTTKRKWPGGAPGLRIASGRVGRSGSCLSGSAPFADERQLHDATFRSADLAERRRTFDVPPRCFMPARRTEQRHASVAEVQKRIVSVQAADESPQLRHYRGISACRVGRIRSHDLRTPMLVPCRLGRFLSPTWSAFAASRLRRDRSFGLPATGISRGVPERPSRK